MDFNVDTEDWQAFPHVNAKFRLSPAELKKAWGKLHAGDCEPFPDPKHIAKLDPAYPDPEGAAETLIDAWSAFHAGEFARAVDLGSQLGVLGHSVINKASGIYADYLEDDEVKQKEIYQSGMALAQSAIEAFPKDPNAHYFHAFMTGRYSQCISITQALKEGLASRVKTDVVNTLKLAPKHGEAQLALGLFHAEVINKVGKMVGAVTYGASADEALKAFDQAISLIPHSPITWIEYGNALYLLFGDKRLEESNDAYVKASTLDPRDAMEKLDVEYAKASLA